MVTPVLTYRFAAEASPYRDVACHVLRLIQARFEVVFEEKDVGQLCFGNGTGQYPLPQPIYQPLSQWEPCDEKYLRGMHVYSDDEGRRMDILASIFFIMHCLGESLSGNTLDRYGRITYYQSRYGKYHEPYEDLITPLMREFLLQYFSLSDVMVNSKRLVVLSHDIDLLTSGLRRELGFFFRKPSFSLAKALMSHLFTRNKIWADVSTILDLEEEMGFKSVFYFIPEQRSFNGIANADYDAEFLHSYAERVLAAHCEAGLHKSSSDDDYFTERTKLSLPVDSNRNHYLRYRLPDDWKRLGEAVFRTDTGLGWSDSPGLRNGFPFAFQPFGTSLTVIPLVLMDTCFDRDNNVEKIAETFSTMISGWSEGFQVSVLFHNNYLTPWSNSAFLEQYCILLRFLKEEGIEVVKPSYFN